MREIKIRYFTDPEAVKPSDWEDEMDGEWEAPLVDNPKCSAVPGCGQWKAPLMANPDYKVFIKHNIKPILI